ncbi:MAG: hypothetical protein ACNS60_04435 [Candidatus Cyclobacteriaceae bacterium M2_1C_046]
MVRVQRILGVVFILLLGLGFYFKLEHNEHANTLIAIGGIGAAIVIIPLIIRRMYKK